MERERSITEVTLWPTCPRKHLRRSLDWDYDHFASNYRDLCISPLGCAKCILRVPPPRARACHRRLGQPERAKSLVHAMFLRALSCPSSLLRFPLAFLEAFPACVAPPESSPHRPLASSLSRTPRGTGLDDAVAEVSPSEIAS